MAQVWFVTWIVGQNDTDLLRPRAARGIGRPQDRALASLEALESL